MSDSLRTPGSLPGLARPAVSGQTRHAPRTLSAPLWALLIAALLQLCTHAAANGLPLAFEVEYELEAMGATVGETLWRLRDDNGVLVYESRSEPAGLYALIRSETILERSRMLAAGGALKPLNYQYRREGGKRSRFVEVDFDWQRGRVTNTAKGRTWDMDVPAGTLDKLSYLLALMRDLSAGRRELRYDIAGGGKLQRYEMAILAEERIDTPLGTLQTVKLKRKFRTSRQTTLWCAQRYGYLPVRIEHKEKDGTVLTVTAQRVSGLRIAR